jgi:hypothetical protein
MAGRLADILQLRRLRLGREQTATASSLSDSLTLSETTHHLPNRSPLTFHNIIIILALRRTPTFTKDVVKARLRPHPLLRCFVAPIFAGALVISCDSLFKMSITLHAPVLFLFILQIRCYSVCTQLF